MGYILLLEIFHNLGRKEVAERTIKTRVFKDEVFHPENHNWDQLPI